MHAQDRVHFGAVRLVTYFVAEFRLQAQAVVGSYSRIKRRPLSLHGMHRSRDGE